MAVTFEQTVSSYPVTRRESAQGRLPSVQALTSPHPEHLHTDAAFCPPSSPSSCRLGRLNSFGFECLQSVGRSVGSSVGVADAFQTPLDAGGGLNNTGGARSGEEKHLDPVQTFRIKA